jgi:hypothetical protein
MSNESIHPPRPSTPGEAALEIPVKALDRRGVKRIAGCDEPLRGLDLVFLHGLDGDAYETWMADKDDGSTLWPAWLASDFRGQFGVWTVGYAASSSAWVEQSMPLADRGLSLLESMFSNGLGQRPLVFIAHSMGGIVVKQLLRLAVDQGVERYRPIAKMVCGIAFLATPHAGSIIASFAKFVSVIYRTNEHVRDLGRHDSRLSELHGAFLAWVAERRASAAPALPIVCRSYSERREVRGSFLPKGLIVVDASSAEANIPGERAIPLDEDHISIAKPLSRCSPLYQSICAFLKECINAASLGMRTAPSGTQSVDSAGREVLAQVDQRLVACGTELTGSPGHGYRSGAIDRDQQWLERVQSRVIPEHARLFGVHEGFIAWMRRWILGSIVVMALTFGAWFWILRHEDHAPSVDSDVVIESITVDSRLRVSLTHPALAAYRARLSAGISSVVQQGESWRNNPEMDVVPHTDEGGRVERVAILGGGLIPNVGRLPDGNERAAELVLGGGVCIAVFREPGDPLSYRSPYHINRHLLLGQPSRLADLAIATPCVGWRMRRAIAQNNGQSSHLFPAGVQYSLLVAVASLDTVEFCTKRFTLDMSEPSVFATEHTISTLRHLCGAQVFVRPFSATAGDAVLDVDNAQELLLWQRQSVVLLEVVVRLNERYRLRLTPEDAKIVEVPQMFPSKDEPSTVAVWVVHLPKDYPSLLRRLRSNLPP